MAYTNLEQRHLYNARLKSQLDGPARLEMARREGFEIGVKIGIEQGRVEGLRQSLCERIEKGIEKGQVFGRIMALQNHLGVNESNRAELLNYSDVELSELIERLKHQLRSRSS